MSEAIDDVFDSETGRFRTDKIDINEISQYCLLESYIFSLLNSPTEDPINALLPTEMWETSKQNVVGLKKLTEPYEFPGIYTIDSSGQISSESTNEIINYLLSRKFSDKLLDLTSKDISSLVSFLKLFRIPREGDKTLYNLATEIAFSTHYNKSSLETFFQDNTSVGLKSASIEIISNTGAYYNYQISIDLFFANSNVLMADENYKALLTTPTKDPNKEPIVYCLVFGWADNNISERTKDLSAQQTALLLYIKNYNLEFNIDGSVSLKVNFIGAAENEKEVGNAANMMYTDGDAADYYKKFKEAYDTHLRQYNYHRERYTKRYNEYMEKINQESERLLRLDASANPDDSPYIKALKEEMEGDPNQADFRKIFGSDFISLPNEKLNMEIAERQLKDIKNTITNFKYGKFLEDIRAGGNLFEGEVNFVYTFNKNDVLEKASHLEFFPRLRFEKYDPADENQIDATTVKLRSKIALIKQLDKEKNQNFIDKTEKEIIDIFIYQNFPGNITDKDLKKSESSGASYYNYGKVHFRYILLGDLIGLAHVNALINSNPKDTDLKVALEQEEFSTLLGTFDINMQEDYVSNEYKNNQGKENFEKTFSKYESFKTTYLGKEERVLTFDLAKFPISYNIFAAWWIKNIIEPGVETYSYNNFIKNFLNDCVLGSIKSYSSWDAKYRRTTSQRTARVRTLSAYKDETIATIYTDLPYDLAEINDDPEIKVLPVNKIKETFYDANKEKYNPFVNNYVPHRDTKKYAFIYGEFGNAKHKSDYESNLRAGIFHFYVGASTGILKDIKFVPLTGPYVNEAAILSADKENKQTPLSEKFNLIQRFDVNITCVGFQYFKPGQLIYIDTSLIGFGKASDQNSPARRFTLGGYYIITKTSHHIEGTEFKTSLTAKFHDYGS